MPLLIYRFIIFWLRHYGRLLFCEWVGRASWCDCNLFLISYLRFHPWDFKYIISAAEAEDYWLCSKQPFTLSLSIVLSALYTHYMKRGEDLLILLSTLPQWIHLFTNSIISGYSWQGKIAYFWPQRNSNF